MTLKQPNGKSTKQTNGMDQFEVGNSNFKVEQECLDYDIEENGQPNESSLSVINIETFN